MKQTHILFDDPGNFSSRKHYPYEGSSPKFIKALKSYLTTYRDKIKTINLALYLFNNPELHSIFLKLAEKGIQINVISIPLEGYDNSNPKEIVHEDGSPAFKENQTKYSLALDIYNSFKPALKNYKLYIFSHTYLRSPWIKSFSRGKIPYSLHIKSLLIESHSGEYMSGLFSTNLAARDSIKHETFILHEIQGEEAITHQQFFNDLIKSSVPFNEFKEQSKNIDAQIKLCDYYPNKTSLFISPFYDRSPEHAEKLITDILDTAKKRIWIVSQHLSAYKYKIPLNFKVSLNVTAEMNKKGILHKAIMKGQEGIELRCISQTYADKTTVIQNFRKPVNAYSFQRFVNAYKGLPNAYYYVNDALHSKYIIVDDLVIATTFNYTPTQFIYLPHVEINKFQNIETLRYKGVFSEVGQMLILKRKSEVACFVKNFEFIINDKRTSRVI